MTEARQMLEMGGSGTVADSSYAGACISKWGRLLESKDASDPVQRPYIKKVTAILLENEMTHLKTLQEDTLTNNTGYFTKYIFPILRRVWPNLIANQIVSVQPMNSPVGGVFYYEKKYSNRKGSKVGVNPITNTPLDMNYQGKLKAGDNMMQNLGRYYSSEFVDYDVTCEDTGTASTTLSNASANSRITEWSPIRDNGVAGQRAFTVKAFYRMADPDDSGALIDVIATMNDSGNLIDNTANANTVGTFNIGNGQWTITPKGSAGTVSGAAFANNTVVYFQYYVDWEKVYSTGGAEIPSVELDMHLSTIQAESRKLKARWSVEAVDDMRALHGKDVETEIVGSFANEVLLEVDRGILDELIVGALHSTSYTYNSSIPGEMESIRELLTKISAMSARIHKTTQRAPANFIVAAPAVISLLDQLSTHGDYASVEQNVKSASYGPVMADYGISRVGTLLNKWAVYADPFMEETKILVGLKGKSFYDAGFVYAPYVPLEVTPTFLDPEDQSFRKGVRTRYATKMLRAEYYGIINVAGLPSVTTIG